MILPHKPSKPKGDPLQALLDQMQGNARAVNQVCLRIRVAAFYRLFRSLLGGNDRHTKREAIADETMEAIFKRTRYWRLYLGYRKQQEARDRLETPMFYRLLSWKSARHVYTAGVVMSNGRVETRGYYKPKLP